jgi:putative flippase GtrA
LIGILVGLLVQPLIANFPDFIGFLNLKLGLSAAMVRIAAFLFFVILAPFALYVAYWIGKKLPVMYEFAKFAAVGALNSFVDLGIFNLETFLYGREPQGMFFAGMKAFSFLCATTNSFFWNKYWTFHSAEKAQVGEVLKFYGIAISGGLINTGIATFFYTVVPRPESVTGNAWLNIVSPLAGILTAFIWNYLGYKFIVFRKKSDA